MKIEVNYTGQFLHRHENHTEQGFCSHLRTVISAQYIQLRGRICAAPISKLESHISDRCSYYTIGQLLRRRENHTGQGFCSHIRTVISAQYIQLRGRICAALISKLESHISDRCSYYTTGQLLRRRENHTGQGFCSHTRTVISAQYIQLRERSCAVPISKAESHISDRCSHSCRYSVNIAL